MPTIVRTPPLIESLLLRRSVGALASRRDRCAHCHRTPLVGERVHHYDGPAGSELVCDLCRPRREDAPRRSELMHAPEHERTVRVLGAAT